MAKFDSPIDLLKYITDNYVTFTDAEIKRLYDKAVLALADDLSPMNGDYTPTPDADDVYEALEDLIERREAPPEDEDEDEDDDVDDVDDELEDDELDLDDEELDDDNL